MRDASGYPFYNTSKFTFETLKADPENIEDNFNDYSTGSRTTCRTSWHA